MQCQMDQFSGGSIVSWISCRGTVLEEWKNDNSVGSEQKISLQVEVAAASSSPLPSSSSGSVKVTETETVCAETGVGSRDHVISELVDSCVSDGLIWLGHERIGWFWAYFINPHWCVNMVLIKMIAQSSNKEKCICIHSKSILAYYLRLYFSIRKVSGFRLHNFFSAFMRK